MDAMQVLVVILSIFLALFLILAIVLIVMLIRVTKQIKSVTNTAESAAHHINNLAMNASKISSPALLAKFVLNQVKKARKKSK